MLMVFAMAMVVVPKLSLAEDTPLTRREGFMMIWQGILRSVEDTRSGFLDIRKDQPGGREINFALSRGILDETRKFSPSDTLRKKDAIVWLLRTRNVADLDDLQEEDIAMMLRRYPLIDPGQDLSKDMKREELEKMVQEMDAMLAQEVHEVSLYAEEFHGDGTAFGEAFDMYALTAAHRTLPYNTLLRVTNVENNKKVIVRINDRGPYVEGRDMDLSLAAFEMLAPRSKGVIHATFQRLGDTAMVGICGDRQRYQRRLTRDVHFTRGVPHTFPLGEALTLQANRPFVVRSVYYPDGTKEHIEDWVLTGERFSFRPSTVGTYIFRISTANRRTRDMSMTVERCVGA